MSINNKLRKFARENLVLRRDKSELDQIKKSVGSLISYLESELSEEVKCVRKFGSYDRNTILPRNYDYASDIDLLIVFNDDQHTHQTYLNKIKKR